MTDTPDQTVSERSLTTMTVGDLPRPTPKAAEGQIAAPGVEVDGKGVPFDPARHERRTKADGSWCLKRGNGARRAAGLPNAGRLFQNTNPPPPTPSAPSPAADAPQASAAAAAPASEFAPGSRLGSLEPETDGTLVPEIETAPTLTEADYQPTGDALSRGFFALAQLTLDREPWEPAPGEQKALAGALTRVWHHYSLPRIGALAELVLVLLPIFAKRADAPKTRRAFGWFAGLFARRNPPPTQPTQATVERVEPATPPRTVPGSGLNPRPTSRFKMVGG